MAHFAEIDASQGNLVKRVIVVANEDCLDDSGQESEIVGINFCTRLFGGEWIQTSYNANFRKNFAGIGSLYLADKDCFTEPKPFPSWVFNFDDNCWVAPKPMPSDPSGRTRYFWSEEQFTWIPIHESET